MAKYEDLSFPTPNDGWVSTALGEILHTSDGGYSWNVQMNGLGIVRSIDFMDAQRGFAGTLLGDLFWTDDAGRSWTEISARLPKRAKGFCAITHVGSDVHAVGRFIGQAADYFHSRDAGTSWEYSDLRKQAQGLVDVSFVDDTTGFIGGMAPSDPPNRDATLILKTINRGRTWRRVYVHDGGRGFAWKLWPISAKVIVAALQSEDGIYRIARSRDGGEAWATIVVDSGRPLGYAVQSVGFVNDSIGWIGGMFQGLYSTADGGDTWQKVELSDRSVNRFEKVGQALLTGGSNGILKYRRPVRPSAGTRSSARTN